MLNKLGFLLLFLSLPFFIQGGKSKSSNASYYLVVDKSEHSIILFDALDWLIEWPCTFGSKDLSDKYIQGDRKTPEGSFQIVRKYTHQKWNKFMMLDYPTKADQEKFLQRKKQGIIPNGAKIGGSIGIHGTWPKEDFAVEYLQEWTLGCVSMKNEHINELFKLVPVGTTVIIKK